MHSKVDLSQVPMGMKEGLSWFDIHPASTGEVLWLVWKGWSSVDHGYIAELLQKMVGYQKGCRTFFFKLVGNSFKVGDHQSHRKDLARTSRAKSTPSDAFSNARGHLA